MKNDTSTEISEKTVLTGKQSPEQAFEDMSEVHIGKQIYIVERHFLGKREMTEAINTVITNSAKHVGLPDKIA